MNEWGMIYVCWYLKKLFLVWKAVMGRSWMNEGWFMCIVTFRKYFYYEKGSWGFLGNIEKCVGFVGMLFYVVAIWKVYIRKIWIYLKKVRQVSLITTTSKLSFESQISSTCEKARQKLRALTKTVNYMNLFKRKVLMKTFAIP